LLTAPRDMVGADAGVARGTWPLPPPPSDRARTSAREPRVEPSGLRRASQACGDEVGRTPSKLGVPSPVRDIMLISAAEACWEGNLKPFHQFLALLAQKDRPPSSSTPDSVICGKSGLDHFRCMRKHPARFRKASANSARLRLFISGHPLFFSLIPFRELTVKSLMTLGGVFLLCYRELPTFLAGHICSVQLVTKSARLL
jgi:hypothetical protein